MDIAPRLKELADRLQKIAGSLKTEKAKNAPIYGSFHLPGFEIDNTLRNTLARMNKCAIPRKLNGLRVLELASNVGALSFELARRGATTVGIEYRADRVQWANEFAQAISLPCQFYEGDLEQEWPAQLEQQSYDFVICCSVDDYLVDKNRFFERLRNLNASTLWLELNDRSGSRKPWETIVEPFRERYDNVQFMGMDGDRHIIMLNKQGQPWPLPARSERYKTEPPFTKIVTNPQRYEFLKWACEQIKHIPYVVPMTFEASKIQAVDLRPCKRLSELTSYEKIVAKKQFIDFIKSLSAAGFTHRDLHADNLLFKEGRLYVVDWDLLSVHVAPLQQAWDLKGELGRNEPNGVGPLFNGNRNWASVVEVLDLKLSDFNKQKILHL